MAGAMQTVLHLAAPNHRRNCVPQPDLDVRGQYPGHLVRARSGALQLHAYAAWCWPRAMKPTATRTTCPIAKMRAAGPDIRMSASKACSDILGQTYFATYGYPDVHDLAAAATFLAAAITALEPDRAGNHSIGVAGQAASATSDGRRSAIIYSRMALAAYLHLADTWPDIRKSTARLSIFPPIRKSAAEMTQRILRPDGLEPRSRHPRQTEHGNQASVSSARRAPYWAGAPALRSIRRRTRPLPGTGII